MKRMLSTLAFSGLLALGVFAVAPSAQASALAGGAKAVDVAKIVDRGTSENLIEVNHRKRHWHRHHDDRRWRHRKPRSGFFLEFGTRGLRYGPPPYYARPRYVVPRATHRMPSAHVNWCYARYRSYRASDNTFQPYNGPRRACISPYWR